MGLFRDLGRRAERFKQLAAEAASESVECADCGRPRSPDVEACPECGCEDVVEAD